MQKQKLKSITLENFKFFYKRKKLELDCKNLLLYGENGSGKSSIYWALYTFLQSSLKSNNEIKKYFDPSNSQNLRNRFAKDTDESAIILEIKDDNGTRNIEISNNNLQTNNPSDKTINKILSGSDFINYRYLSKLYDFKNSEEIDLFPLFEREVLMFIDFEESYTDNRGELSESTLAGDWWNFICNAPDTLPKNIRNKNTPSQSSEAYRKFREQTIPKFIELLKLKLQTITYKANEILLKEFEENYEIDFCLSSIKCEYNKKVDTSQKSRDGKIHPPKIPLKLKFNNHHLSEDKKTIDKPHTFLNEARLTAVALSIKLAILEQLLFDDNSAKLLILDDLLISLDMGNRDKVIDIIFKKIEDYQLLILTHDRAFYNLCKRRIGSLSDKNKWVFKEMYQSTENNTNIPYPLIIDYKNYLDLAKKYLKEFDYPASANYLRKETERVLKELLPKNKTLITSEKESCKLLNLGSLISKFESFYTRIGGNYEPFEKLKEYKDLLMNPLSHDNIESPIYKQEIISAISIVENLNKIKKKIIETDSTLTLKEVDTNSEEWEYTIILKENLHIMQDLTGKILFTNPECLFYSRKNINTGIVDNRFTPVEIKINNGYGKIRHTLGDKTDALIQKEFKDILYQDGVLISV